MAQKPNNKKANQGKPVYKPRQQPAAQAQSTSAAGQVGSDAPPVKAAKVDWTQMLNASNLQQAASTKPSAKPVDFGQIHSGANSASQPAFQSAPAEAPESQSQGKDGGRNQNNQNVTNNQNQSRGNQHYQQRNTNSARQHQYGERGPQGQGGHQRNNNSYGGQGHYNNNNGGRGGGNAGGRGGHGGGRGGHGGGNYQNQNFQANAQAMIGGMTPQMLANQPQLLTHQENMQHMELSDIESLFTSICSQLDPELLQATLQQAGMPFKGGMPGSGPQMPNSQQRGGKGKNNQYQNNNNNSNNQGGHQSNYQRGADGAGRGKKYQAQGGNQNSGSNQGGRGSGGAGQHSMPMPGEQRSNKGGAGFQQKMDSSDFPSFGQGGPSGNNQKMEYRAKKPTHKSSGDYEDADTATDMSMASNHEEMKKQSSNQQQQQMPVQSFFTNAVQMNLCQEHFPEPIMMFKDKPLCGRCIQQQFSQQQAQLKKMSHTQAAMNNARLLGINPKPLNVYQSEKQKISRSIQRLDNFKKQFRYIEDDIKQREQMSAEHMRILTPLMNSMLDKLDELQIQGEQKFKNKIFQIVRNQQKNIQDDMKIKLPQFYNRLQQKYGQLQQASNLAQQRGAQELIETLKHYETIFIELDAEYEKYFNDYEKMSKLQRLLDKDANEIVRDFTDMVERNLRVDYNIKSSFGHQYPQRLHSFQWNQKCVQLYRLKTSLFEKKPVQMTYDVPLYSRSIATETGTIYLTGGYVKHMGVYLKNCYRYDDLFGILNPVSHMNYPHADHSICTIQNFIYVIGTFVGNQVYGYCEVYDTQKDKWKLIADMRVPRTGTSLCVFKNNYIFAFGGRIDQKRIVDTIEVYDISRNVWQEICAPKVDKSNWVPSYMGLAHQITDNEILLFGGKSAVTFHIFNGCFVFDVEKMEIRERGSLVNPCSFMNTPLVFNSNLYAYGNDIYVHQYNIPEQKWSVIPKSNVVLPKA